MPLLRVRTEWTGLPGSPGLSTHYFNGNTSTVGAQCAGLVSQFWQDCGTEINVAAKWRILPDVDRIDEVTGEIVGSDPVSVPGGAGLATGGLEWTAKQGVLRLNTALFTNGQRLQGRLFIPAPSTPAGEQTTSSTYRLAIENAAQGLIDEDDALGQWVVWSRTNGNFGVITTPRVNEQWGVLRSRRT